MVGFPFNLQLNTQISKEMYVNSAGIDINITENKKFVTIGGNYETM